MVIFTHMCSEVEWLWQNSYSPQGLCYLPSGPLEKKFVILTLAYWLRVPAFWRGSLLTSHPPGDCVFVFVTIWLFSAFPFVFFCGILCSFLDTVIRLYCIQLDKKGTVVCFKPLEVRCVHPACPASSMQWLLESSSQRTAAGGKESTVLMLSAVQAPIFPPSLPHPGLWCSTGLRRVAWSPSLRRWGPMLPWPGTRSYLGEHRKEDCKRGEQQGWTFFLGGPSWARSVVCLVGEQGPMNVLDSEHL